MICYSLIKFCVLRDKVKDGLHGLVAYITPTTVLKMREKNIDTRVEELRCTTQVLGNFRPDWGKKNFGMLNNMSHPAMFHSSNLHILLTGLKVK